jgi:hypothetical protein
VGSWDQSPHYFTSLLGNLRDRFRALAAPRNVSVCESDLVAERGRLDHALTRAVTCLPRASASASASSGVSSGVAEEGLDAHSSAMLSALKVQCLAALSAVHRRAARVSEGVSEGASEVLAEAMAEFSAMLEEDAKAAGRKRSAAQTSVVDDGDVAAGESACASASGSVSSPDAAASRAHMTSLQKSLLDILGTQRELYSGQSGGAKPLSHVMRTSLSKRSRASSASGSVAQREQDDIHHSRRFDGVDVGADYHGHNPEEHSRRALLDLLKECSFVRGGEGECMNVCFVISFDSFCVVLCCFVLFCVSRQLP